MSEIFNVSTNPHVRSKDTTQTIMRDVLIALAPASIFGIYNFGVQALIRIIVGIVVCMASEAVYEYFMHKKITVMDLSAAVTGLLIALNIPSTLNIGFEIVWRNWSELYEPCTCSKMFPSYCIYRSND